MKEIRLTGFCRRLLFLFAICAGMAGLFFTYIPQELIRAFLFVFCAVVIIGAVLWTVWQRCLLSDFSNDVCETVDTLMEGRELENFSPYEETAFSKVQEKLLQYYEKMKEEQQESAQDKQTIQELVSDISHQVKTPTANIQMIAGILSQHELSREKQKEFFNLMAVQINKLDFLMQSLIKMSRLETGTFVLHPEECRLKDTIAQAMSTVLAKAEKKNIQLSADCDSKLTVKHDPKWTAEAIGNILDNPGNLFCQILLYRICIILACNGNIRVKTAYRRQQLMDKIQAGGKCQKQHDHQSKGACHKEKVLFGLCGVLHPKGCFHLKQPGIGPMADLPCNFYIS